MTANRDDYHILWFKAQGEQRVVHASTPERAREIARKQFKDFEEVSMQSQREFMEEMRS